MEIGEVEGLAALARRARYVERAMQYERGYYAVFFEDSSAPHIAVSAQLRLRTTGHRNISPATRHCYFAMPTLLRRCFFCSIASSTNAATALRDTVKPILGAAPSRLRYAEELS